MRRNTSSTCLWRFPGDEWRRAPDWFQCVAWAPNWACHGLHQRLYRVRANAVRQDCKFSLGISCKTLSLSFMHRILSTQLASRLATLVAVVGFVVAGFLHSFHHVHTPVDPDIAAYLASGGSLSDICMTGGEGDSDAHHAFNCDACPIKSALSLATFSKTAQPKKCAVLVLALPQCDGVVIAHEFDLARACRAPPAA